MAETKMNSKLKAKLKKAEKDLLLYDYTVLAPNKIKCCNCGTAYSVDQGNYPMSNSPVHEGCSALYTPAKDGKGGQKPSRMQNFAPYCKKCREAMLGSDNDIERLMDVLMLIDKPYIQDAWNSVIEKHYGKTKMISVLGHYLSNINLNHDGMRFKDSDEYMDDTVEKSANKVVQTKKYNSTWMGSYTKEELKYLENYYSKLQEDFNVLTQNHIDYARKIAKASLLMDREFEDILDGKGSDSSYEKYKRIFDDLSKSAQFAESGRGKSIIGNGLTEIVEAVENKNWIYKRDNYKKDDIDVLLDQFGNISKSL